MRLLSADCRLQRLARMGSICRCGPIRAEADCELRPRRRSRVCILFDKCPRGESRGHNWNCSARRDAGFSSRQPSAAHARPDLIVADPPRMGLDAEITALLAEVAAPDLVYVSCDPATLARDLRVLISSGYEIQSMVLADLFPRRSIWKQWSECAEPDSLVAHRPF